MRESVRFVEAPSFDGSVAPESFWCILRTAHMNDSCAGHVEPEPRHFRQMRLISACGFGIPGRMRMALRAAIGNGLRCRSTATPDEFRMDEMKPNAASHNPDPAYLRGLLDAAGLSQRKAAEVLGISDRVMRYYLSDQTSDKYRPAPYPVQFALECLARSS